MALEPYDLAFFATPHALRAWLVEHHDTETELWIGRYKKNTSKASVTWPRSSTRCCSAASAGSTARASGSTTRCSPGGSRPAGQARSGVRLLLIVTLFIGWFIWSLSIWDRGQAPGKQLMHMRVVYLQNTNHVSWGRMSFRELNCRSVIGFVAAITFLRLRPLLLAAVG